jgi:hypothetical protein
MEKPDPTQDPMPDEDPASTADTGKLSADVVVFCDESGAKGYADQLEKEPGEIGIFAGFPVRRENLGLLAAEFKNELAEFRENTGKIHIAEMSPERQERLRQKVYTVLLRRPIFSFYEAIHVQGFHSAYKRDCEFFENLAAKLGKTPKKKPVPQSLHVHLFLGFYASILGFCSRVGITSVAVEIRTDRVDGPILNKFYSAGEDFLSDTRNYEVTRWDRETSKVTEGSVTLKLKGSPAPIAVRDCLIKPAADDSDLVLAADVLANSLNYHFRNRPTDKKFGPLNIKEAISTHPLAPLLIVRQSRSVWDFADSFFAHPSNPERPKLPN